MEEAGRINETKHGSHAKRVTRIDELPVKAPTRGNSEIVILGRPIQVHKNKK